MAKAAEYHQTLLQIPQMYQLDTPFVNVIKEAIVLCGRPISTHVLPPASPLDEQRRHQRKPCYNSSSSAEPDDNDDH